MCSPVWPAPSTSRVEDLVGHVFFGLLMRFARTHGTVQIALGGGFDDVLDRQRGDTLGAAKIAPQKFCAIQKRMNALYHLITSMERVRK